MRTVVPQSHRGSRNPKSRPSAEVTRRNGVARVRYPNGILVSEHRFKDGLLHGLCREWDENGNLLGEYRMVHGTGVQREWHDNGQLKIEISTVRGEFCGRNRIWLRDGTLISERFYVYGRQVEPAEYAKASVEDESIPRYPEGPSKLPGKTRALKRQIHQVFIHGLLEREDRQEARRWLAPARELNTQRLLGRFPSLGTCVAFVESIYDAGADEVIVLKIYRDEGGNEFAEALLVRLPKGHTVREKVRSACTVLRDKALGSCQPESDIGEDYLYLAMT